MSDPLIRGRVVVRGRRFSVVWEHRGADLVLLEIIRPRRPCRHDVPLELPDLVAGEITLADSVVRPRRKPAISAAGHLAVGMLPGATMCRVVHALVRCEADDAVQARFRDHDRHRRGDGDRLEDTRVHMER